jgi:5-dehydro-2-deoxygluconokinase
VGFAIGRSIWGEALKGYLDGSLDRSEAAERIGRNYLRFIEVYERSEVGAPS